MIIIYDGENMKDQNTPIPKRVYSKSTGFYADTKKDFFDSNEALLIKAENQNKFYTEQPPRTNCKICGHSLSSESDFTSHQINYVFCNNCGHLNGANEDTKVFAEKLYIQEDGGDYAKNYIDNNFASRTEHIYTPKVNFLLTHLNSNVRMKLLDVGCGAGYFVYAALLKGVDASGIDVSKSMIDFGNQNISHLYKQSPLNHASESEFFDTIANSDATIISAIGVIEHLREPLEFFEAFQRSNAEYLFYSVPMFSFSVMLENVFTDVFPRQLSGGHTHLFTEQSIEWLNLNRELNSIAEWRFGTDIMDLYRSMSVKMTKMGASLKFLNFLNDGLGKNIDQLQCVLDEKHFCSEIHCLSVKR